MPASETAGTFTCSALQKVIAKVDKAWKDNQQKQEYIPQVEVVTALRKEQTARLEELSNPKKDVTLKIYWVKDCNTGVEDDNENDCDISGPEAESNCEEYALSIKKSVSFSNRENMGRTNDINREDALAVQMLARMKELDETVAQTAVTKLNSFAGVNQFTGGIGGVDGVTTWISPSYWTGDLYGYFAQVTIMNKLSNPFLIHGSNLFQQKWNYEFVQANANGKDMLPKVNSIRSYWDMFNVDAINTPDSVSYLITRGAVALANKAYYPLNNPIEFLTDKPSKRWSIESKSIPGFFYDVIYTMTCDGEDVIHNYKIKAKFDVFLNPFGCNEEVTGVLKFVCGDPPDSNS
jgi:hypothetical protein